MRGESESTTYKRTRNHVGAAAFSDEQMNHLLDEMAALLNERGATADGENECSRSEEESDSDSYDVEEVAGFSSQPASKPGQHDTPFLEKGTLTTPETILLFRDHNNPEREINLCSIPQLPPLNINSR